MNKKLLTGLVSTAVVGAFWACGDGNINALSQEDESIMSTYVPGSTYLVEVRDNAMADCKNDQGCYLKYMGYFEGTDEAPASSSSESTNLPGLSSSSGFFPSNSSAVIIGKRSSSSVGGGSEPEESSSSVALSSKDLGTCAPSASPIDKGGKVRWEFKSNSANADYTPIDFAKAKFVWNYGGLTDDGSAAGTKSGYVTYTQSGQATASVTVTMADGVSSQVTCSPLQVNGAAITKCACTPDVESPDVAGGPVTVTWTVSGCVTDANIEGYEWTKATGAGEIATAVVETKGDEVVPTVTVSNDDNTKQSFTCTGVKAIDGSAPDYAIMHPNDTTEVIKPGKTSITMGGGTNLMGCQIHCKQASGAAVTVTWGSTQTKCASNCYHFDVNATNASCSGVQTFETTAEVVCGANWW